MNTNIQTYANAVLNYMRTNDFYSLEELKSATDLNDIALGMAIGWLMHEGKICRSVNDDTEKYGLKFEFFF